MLKLFLGLFLSGVGVIGVTLQQMDWLVVAIEAKEGPGPSIKVPVPMFAVHQGVRLIPPEALRDLSQEIAPHRDLVMGLLNAVTAAPDGSYVEIHSTREQVEVTKSGRYLTVRVQSPDQCLRVQLPLKSVSRLFERLSRPPTS